MIDFKKINIKFYSNVYLLFQQNIILDTLNDFIMFFSINFTKSFF